MKPFEYYAPVTVNDAVSTLAAFAGEGRLLAGGQSLLLAMKQRSVSPRALVSIANIGELRGITQSRPDEPLRIGATTTYSALESAVLRGWHSEIAAVAADLADRPVRTMGTVGGALCQADPRFDLPVLLTTLDARLHITAGGGTRDLSARDFLADGSPAVGSLEILTRIDVPPLTRFTGVAFEKFRLRTFEAALVSVACAAQVDEGIVSELRLFVGGIEDTPQDASSTCVQLVGMPVSKLDASEAGHAVAEEVFRRDSAGTARQHYQRQLIIPLARQAIIRALGRGEL